jgi:hypothetical protein
MKNIVTATFAAGVLATAALASAPLGSAAPSRPNSAADALRGLQGEGYTVIVNRVGGGALEACTSYAVRPGSTYARMDSGFPGAGDDLITRVVSMTVYLDAAC